MAPERRLVVALTDVLAVRLTCDGCGAAVSLNRADIDGGIRACPACGVKWDPRGVEALLHAFELDSALKLTPARRGYTLYTIAFEVVEPHRDEMAR